MTEGPLRLLQEIIQHASDAGASDVHISDDDGAALVKAGRLDPIDGLETLAPGTVESWVAPLVGPARTALVVDGPDGYVDRMAPLSDTLRARFAFRRQQGGIALTARLLPASIPTVDELAVPDQIVDLINRPNGLVLVSGPTGAGKTTLLAALINEVNQTQHKHVMTIESPIEFQFTSSKSRISQREIGPGGDAQTAASALRSALRSRPDIIVVAELLTVDDARAALDASTKGHLVFATSHAGSAADAIAAFVGSFPGEEQSHAAARLSSSLQAVVVQQLVASTNGGQVAARELLLRQPGIANMIRTANYTGIYNAIVSAPDPVTGDVVGMFRFEEELVRLVEDGQVEVDVALAVANEREHLINSLNARGGRR